VIVLGWYLSALGGSPTGITFAANTGHLLTYPLVGYPNRATWGMVLLLGVVGGAALAAWRAGEFAWRPVPGFTIVKLFAGGLVMGVGALVADGCNITQGLTNSATLALGSLTAFANIAEPGGPLGALRPRLAQLACAGARAARDHGGSVVAARSASVSSGGLDQNCPELGVPGAPLVLLEGSIWFRGIGSCREFGMSFARPAVGSMADARRSRRPRTAPGRPRAWARALGGKVGGDVVDPSRPSSRRAPSRATAGGPLRSPRSPS
jgi:hypothetical protein